MGKASRDKGARFERDIVNAARTHHLDARRVPLSGGAAGFPDDVLIKDATSANWRLEAKKRARGFKQIYDWLSGGSDALVIAADRQRPLVVCDLGDFLELLARKSS